MSEKGSDKLYQKADGILDLRSRQAFNKGHLVDSTWMSFEDLAESLNQLPAAPAILFLVGNKEEIEEASILLDSKGYEVNGSLVINERTLSFWQTSLQNDWIVGKESKRLWQPSSIVLEWLENHRHTLKVERPTVLDLGCGGGRDAVFLAKQKMQVIAIDNKANVINRAKQLAQSSGAQVKFKCCDLNKVECLPTQAQVPSRGQGPAGGFDVILGVRFLNRALLKRLSDKLNPNGFLLWETFVDNGEQLESPKNPNFILKTGELAEVFKDLDIITDKIQKLPDNRPVNRFIAQKPAGNN